MYFYLQTFVFEVRRPDLSYLTLHVYDEDVLGKEFIAFASLPVTCMRTGIDRDIEIISYCDGCL